MKKQPKVVYVSDDECQVSLNVGSDDGVKVGDRFLIYSLSDHEIIDPDTKESLGFLEFVKGTGKVIHVQDKLCTISSIAFKKPSKKVTKVSPGSMRSAFFDTPMTEETVLEGEQEQIPFDSPEKENLAKLL